MPIYSYTCWACDLELERNVKIDDRDNQICEKCLHRLIRQIDAPGAVYAPTSSGGMTTK